MKKFLISLFALIIFTITVQASSYQEAKNRAYNTGSYLINAGYTLKWMNGKYLNQGGYKTYSVYLYSGNRYAVVGGGSNGVRDLDVQVYNRYWDLIAADRDSSSASVVEFYPSRTGTYYIRTKMYSGNGYFFQMLGWK